MDGVKHYMEMRKVNKELENRVIQWFDYIWNNKQSLDEEDILEHLPGAIQPVFDIPVCIVRSKPYKS